MAMQQHPNACKGNLEMAKSAQVQPFRLSSDAPAGPKVEFAAMPSWQAHFVAAQTCTTGRPAHLLLELREGLHSTGDTLQAAGTAGRQSTAAGHARTEAISCACAPRHGAAQHGTPAEHAQFGSVDAVR